MQLSGTDRTILYKDKVEQRIVFFLVFMGVFSLTYGFFFLIDFLPEKPKESFATVESVSEIKEEVAVEDSLEDEAVSIGASQELVPIVEETTIDPLPIEIIFDTLDKRVTVLNPTSTDIQVLDTALLSGVVRHPASADFENEGTIFLFGHSSYLPNVQNKNFQAFNGVQKLEWGDTIRLRSSDREYVYRVDRVYEEKATTAEITISDSVPKLTLVTCNSFGSQDDRYIVEATLVDSVSL